MNHFQRILDLREAMGGRRFLLTCGCGIVTSLLCAMKAISGEVFAAVTLGTVGVYIAGNVTQKVMAPRIDPDDGQNSGV